MQVHEVLRFKGSVKSFRRALRLIKSANRRAGTIANDEVGRRRFQRLLREAQMASIRTEILNGDGGDVA